MIEFGELLQGPRYTNTFKFHNSKLCIKQKFESVKYKKIHNIQQSPILGSCF